MCAQVLQEEPDLGANKLHPTISLHPQTYMALPRLKSEKNAEYLQLLVLMKGYTAMGDTLRQQGAPGQKCSAYAAQ